MKERPTTAERTALTLGGDLPTGRIGYGAMRLTGPALWGPYPDRAAGIAVLREAVDAGVGLIDTADVYGPHSNELLIREALHPYPEDLVIATKGGFVRGGRDLSTISAIGNPQYLRSPPTLSARRLGRRPDRPLLPAQRLRAGRVLRGPGRHPRGARQRARSGTSASPT